MHGWLFGLGMQCSGVSWIFFSLYYHGGSPPALAVLMIFLLASYLSIYPALAGYFVNKYCVAHPALRLLILYPLVWAGSEWLQNIVLTGFGWMQLGYTQIDLPLSGYAPVLGNLGVGLFVSLSAGLLVVVLRPSLLPVKRFTLIATISVAFIWLMGFVLKQVSWTEPAGENIKVSIVQGNVPQQLKWKREMLQPTLKLYHELSIAEKDADLIIWPETAIPSYLHQVPGYIGELEQSMQLNNTDLLVGIFIKDIEKGRYYNSLINVRGGEYRKRHLVPLGEYIPLRFLIGFFNQWINIPMSDIASGSETQGLMRAAGYPLGVSICFEDAFARDVLRDLPEAAILVNVSNDAWFDGSHEAYQHHDIARMRALETGRYMLRATNTGISSVIDPHGDEVAIAQRFQVQVIKADVRPMSGATPYVIWGDYLVLAIIVLVSGFFVYRNPQRY